MTRRVYLSLIAGAASSPLLLGQQKPVDTAVPTADKDWVCPMDPDYRSDKPGVCPRCGMKLRLGVPDRIEYPLEISQAPALLKPNEKAVLTLRILNPETKEVTKQFDIVHEKLIHFFVVSENLKYFAHIHPVLQPDGTFTQEVNLPYGGMYRVLADFYPSGSVPQLAVGTLFVSGPEQPAHLTAEVAPSKAANLTATLQTEPNKPLAGLETKLEYTLNPCAGLQPYLGAWAHMLAASEDLIDLIHVHPFLADGGPKMQFNIIFPRSGLYRIWAQFQREGQVNTTVFTVPVTSL